MLETIYTNKVQQSTSPTHYVSPLQELPKMSPTPVTCITSISSKPDCNIPTIPNTDVSVLNKPVYNKTKLNPTWQKIFSKALQLPIPKQKNNDIQFPMC